MLAWLTWCREQGHTAPTVPVRIKRSTPPDSDTPVRSRIALDRLIARRDIHVREKTRTPQTCPGTAVGDRDVCPDTGPRAAVLRTGPRPARRRARHRRTRHRLGSARAAPLRPHAPRRSGASLLSSWPNRATANPRICADTSNPHPQPYGGSPACLDQEPTGADTQSLMYLVTRFLTTPLLACIRCARAAFLSSSALGRPMC